MIWKSPGLAATLAMTAALAASVLSAAPTRAAGSPQGDATSPVAAEGAGGPPRSELEAATAEIDKAGEVDEAGVSAAEVEVSADTAPESGEIDEAGISAAEVEVVAGKAPESGEVDEAGAPGAEVEPSAGEAHRPGATDEASEPSADAGSPARDGVLDLGGSRVQLRVYGFLNAQVEIAEATGGVTPYWGRGRVSDGNSRLGFSGSVDVAAGLHAIWQLEGGLGSFEQGGLNDRGALGILASRNTFAGLEHPEYGRLVFGFNDSAYRSMVGSAGAFGGNLGLTKTGLDLWNNTTAQMSGNPDSLFGRGEARYANSLHFDSPVVYGAQLGLSYGFDEIAAGYRLRNRFSAGLTYEYGPFKIGIGYDHQTNTGVDQVGLFSGLPFSVGAADGVSTSFAKALATFVYPGTMTSVGAGIEVASYGYSAFLHPGAFDEPEELREGTMRQVGAMASASQGLGYGVTLMASGGLLWKLEHALVGAPKDYKAWQFSAGAKYVLGEHFTAYFVYTQIDNALRQNVNFGQAPVYTNQLGTSDAYLAPGNSPRSVGLGILARF